VYTLTVTNPGPTDPTGRLANAFTIITDTVPISPANLRAAAGDRKVVLGWDANMEIDLAEYQLYRTDVGLLTTTTNTGYLDYNPPLINGITYSYYVTALDVAGQESPLSNIASAQPYDITPYTYTYTPSITYTGVVTNGDDVAGPPDGDAAAITGTGVITLDFGVDTGIIDGPGPDMVIFEWPNSDIDRGTPGNQPGILLDYVIIELSDGVSGWHTVFDWDGLAGGVAGTNIDGYATDADGEQDAEPIPSSDLYPGGLTINTGIAIDIGAWTPPGYSFHLVRLRYPGGGVNPGGNVDAVQRLN
jgi:hypothetical protein